MKLYSWNVNGIRAVIRKDALTPFITSEQPDILCLQETKAQPEEIKLGEYGYHSYVNSAEKKGYSGTAILSKSEPIRTSHNLPAELLTKYSMTEDKYGDPNAEGRILTAEYEQFYLVTVYTVNAKDDLSRIPLRHDHWDPAFLEYCQGLEAGKFGGPAKPVVFCGDLNVAHTPDDLARPKPNVGKRGFTDEEREGFQNFVDAGFIDTFRLFHQGNGFYTWWSHFGNARANNTGWRIDYILVSDSLRSHVTGAEIHPAIMGSDHCPISITLDF
ncbi:MAG TPA: exodeoxyribonuclease III [Candidatus Saccharimonadia bacterium]|nr:exodeoxyribonuclease III [Candidatus Saccharimonadia bacterium]